MISLTQSRSEKIETALIFLLSASIFLSKPLIYLTILLLIGVIVARTVTSHGYRNLLLDSPLFWASTSVFVFGLLATLIGSGYAEDVGWMASKTMLLPMAVPLWLAFSRRTNRTAAISGAMVGFWIAFVLTAHMHNWQWSGERYEGATWLIDAWGVICAMLILLLTPLIFATKHDRPLHLAIVLTLVGAIIMLLTTGARGPWTGVIAGACIYLAIKHTKALAVLVVVATASIFVFSHLYPKQFEDTKNRVESITDFDNNSSSYLRLALWETGYALITKQMLAGDKGFWFGYRKKGRGELPNDFYYDEFIDKAKVKPGILKEYNWKLTDFHSSYLESIFRNGIVWTLGSLFVLGWLAVGPLQRGQGFSSAWIAVPSLAGFLVIGLTYTLLPHFAFLFLIFFLALGRGFER